MKFIPLTTRENELILVNLDNVIRIAPGTASGMTSLTSASGMEFVRETPERILRLATYDWAFNSIKDREQLQ